MLVVLVEVVGTLGFWLNASGLGFFVNSVVV